MRLPLGCLWVGGAYRSISPWPCALGGLLFFQCATVCDCTNTPALQPRGLPESAELSHSLHRKACHITWHHTGTIPQQSGTQKRRLGVTAVWFPIKGKGWIGHKKITEVYPHSKCLTQHSLFPSTLKKKEILQCIYIDTVQCRW